MAKITKDMMIADVLRTDSGLAEVLLNHGMNCVGCPGARGETLERAAAGHGMDVDELIEEMNVMLDTRGAVVE